MSLINQHINKAVRRRLAIARTLVEALPKTERASASRQCYATDAVEWTYAPSHVVHEEASQALRTVGLELDAREIEPVMINDRPAIRVRLQLVIVRADDGNGGGDKEEVGEYEAWSATWLISAEDIGKVGAAAAQASAYGWLKRYQRLDLLDLPCVPADEQQQMRDSAAGRVWERRRQLSFADLPPPRRRAPDPEDEIPDFGPSEKEIEQVEVEILQADAEKARAKTLEVYVEASKNRLGCPDPLETAYEIAGHRDADRVTAGQWGEVTARIVQWKEAG